MRRMNDLKRYFGVRGQAGFSLVETMGAILIISVVVYGVVKIMSSTTEQITKTETASRFDGLNNAALALAKNALVQVGPNRDQGICRVVKTSMKTGGIGFIRAVLPAASDNIFAPDLGRFFESQSWSSQADCKNDGSGYRMCFVPTESNSALPAGGLSKKPVVAVSYLPVTLRPQSGSASGKLSKIPLGAASEENARDLAFMVTTEVSYDDDSASEKGGRKMALTHSMIWAGEFTCQQEVTERGRFGQETKRLISLSPSGIGSGADAHTLFSSQKPLGEEIMSMIYSTVSYTEGWVNQARRAETHMGPDYTFTSACIERQYRCSKSFDPRNWAPTIRLQALAQYNQNNQFVQDSSIAAVLGLKFEDKSGGKSVGAKAQFRGPAQNRAGSYIFTTARTPLEIEVTNGAQSVCPEVCSGANSYNNNSFEDARYRAKTTFVVPGTNINFTVPDTKPTGCICCYGKQCAGIGTKVAGVCHKQPSEPVDSRLPECAASNKVNVEQASPFSALISPTENDTCVSASMEGGKVVFKNESCTTSLPYVCYSQGDYRFALNGLTNQIAQGGFEGGRRACYNMGMVRVLSSEVRDRLTRQQNLATSELPPESGTFFEYLDSALAGTFVAPQAESELARLETLLESHKGKVWVALRNGQYFTYAEPPLVNFATARNVSFFDRNGLLQFKTDPNLGYTEGDKAGSLLVHGRRHYGLFQVNSSLSEDRPALCFNPKRDGFFLSSGKAKNFAEANNLCRAENAVFAAPQNPMHWVSALMMVNRLDAAFPWPTEGNSFTGTPNAAWIALTAPSGGVWQAPTFGITAKQVNARMENVTNAADVTHSICKETNGKMSIVTGAACNTYFSPEAMTPAQRLDFFRQVEKGNLWNSVFKVQAGS